MPIICATVPHYLSAASHLVTCEPAEDAKGIRLPNPPQVSERVDWQGLVFVAMLGKGPGHLWNTLLPTDKRLVTILSSFFALKLTGWCELNCPNNVKWCSSPWWLTMAKNCSPNVILFIYFFCVCLVTNPVQGHWCWVWKDDVCGGRDRLQIWQVVNQSQGQPTATLRQMHTHTHCQLLSLCRLYFDYSMINQLWYGTS